MKEDMAVLEKKVGRSKKNALPLVKSFIDQTEKNIQERNLGDTFYEEILLKTLEAYKQDILSNELPSYRKVIYLKKIGYPQIEIARILQKSRGLISQLVKKAKKKKDLQ